MTRGRSALTVSCLLSLLFLASPGLAEKGGKGGKGDTSSWIRVNAQFEPTTGMAVTKILADSYGSYESKIYTSSGQFVLGANASRSVRFVFDSFLGNASSICYDTSDNPDGPLPILFPYPEDPVLTGHNGLRIMTWREEMSDGTLGPTLNLLNMTHGTSYVQIDFVFNADEAEGMFMVRHGHTNPWLFDTDDGSSTAIVQIDAIDDSVLAGNPPDGIDRWVMRPVQDPVKAGLAVTVVSQANLNRYLASSGGKVKEPARNCNYGDFLMPFEITITRLE